LTAKELWDLDFALGIGHTELERSFFGSELERHMLYAFNEDGEPIPAPPTDWSCIKVNPASNDDVYSAMPSEMALEICSHVERRLLKVGRVNVVSEYALRARYGDRGARWGGTDGIDGDAAVYPLTPAGLAYLQKDYDEHPDPPEGGGPRPDERIVNAIFAHRQKPTDRGRVLVEKLMSQGRSVLMTAHNDYALTRAA
jgi:hypothetical protein